MVGIDHKSAGVQIREKFSLNEQQACHLMYDYKQLGGEGMMILSTCNRTEIYGFGNCPRQIIELFCKHTGNAQDLFFRYQHIKQNREAIEHLFQVGAGLESKILGDFEIIGQIKKAFQLSKDQQASNAFIERLVNSTIQTSKRVKNETSLSSGASSTAFASVQQVKTYLEQHPDISQPNVLLYGSGKIGRTTCDNLVNQTGINKITVVNRTNEKAKELAEKYNVHFLDHADLEHGLNAADIVVVATGAPNPTINAKQFKTNKKRLVLDLSVPRNVDQDLYKNLSYSVIDIDHLSTITEESVQQRQSQIPLAKTILNEMVDEFYTWLEGRKVAPTLQAVREKMNLWKSKEVQNILKKHPELNAMHAELLADQLLNRITGQFARQLKNGEDITNDLRTIHHIFELENHVA